MTYEEDKKMCAYLFIKALKAGAIVAAPKAVGKYAEDEETAFMLIQTDSADGKMKSFHLTNFVGEMAGLKVKQTERTIAVQMKDYTIHEVLCKVCEGIKEKYPFIVVPEDYKEMAWDFMRI